MTLYSPVVLLLCSVPPPSAPVCCSLTLLWRCPDPEETGCTRCRSLVSLQRCLMDTWERIPGTASFLVSHPVFLWCCPQSPLDPAFLRRLTPRALLHAGMVLGSGVTRAPWSLPRWKKAGGAPRAAVDARSVLQRRRRRTVALLQNLVPAVEVEWEETPPVNCPHPETGAWPEGSRAPRQLLKPDTSCRASAELHGLGRRSPEGIPVTHPLEKTYVGTMGAKFELWLAEPGEHWAALSCLRAPRTTSTEGLGERTQGETEWLIEEGLCWTLSEGYRIRTHHRWSLHFHQTSWRMTPLLTEKNID